MQQQRLTNLNTLTTLTTLTTLMSTPQNIRIVLLQHPTSSLARHLRDNSQDARLLIDSQRQYERYCSIRYQHPQTIPNFHTLLVKSDKINMLLYLLGAKQGETHEEMNVVDGVLVEVDLQGGVGRRDEEMVARAVGQRLRVVVFIGGVEKVEEAEEVGERVNGIIRTLNEVVAAFSGTVDSLSIEKGNVALGSTKQGWAITQTPFQSLSSSILTNTPQTLKSQHPLSHCLFHMLFYHLPSPLQSQQFRSDLLFTCPQVSDPKGPLLIYLFRGSPSPSPSEYYLGRVFSGTMRRGVKVKVMCDGYDYDSKNTKNLMTKTPPTPIIKQLTQGLLLSNHRFEPLEEFPCGNFVCLKGWRFGVGTVSECDCLVRRLRIRGIENQVVKVKVEVKEPARLHKLAEGMRKVVRGAGDRVRWVVEETGEMMMRADTVERINLIVKQYEDYLPEITLFSASPIYKQTITKNSSQTCMTRSPNKHNRLYANSQPIIPPKQFNDNHLTPSQNLCTNWQIPTKIWAFSPGPLSQQSNILVDQTQGVTHIREVKDSLAAGFEWSVKEGVLCGEEVRNFRVNLVDCELHTDAIHRGAGQIIPAARRLFYACQIASKPTLIQPIYQITIKSPQKHLSAIIKCFQSHNGRIVSHKMGVYSEIQGEIPVADSFGIEEAMRVHLALALASASVTSAGHLMVDITGIRYEIMEDCVEEEGSKTEGIVKRIRREKGMEERWLGIENYIDHY